MKSYDHEENLLVSWHGYWTLIVYRARGNMYMTWVNVDVQPLKKGKYYKKLADYFKTCLIVRPDTARFYKNSSSILCMKICHPICNLQWHTCTFLVEESETHSVSVILKDTVVSSWCYAILCIYFIISQNSQERTVTSSGIVACIFFQFL